VVREDTGAVMGALDGVLDTVGEDTGAVDGAKDTGAKDTGKAGDDVALSAVQDT